MYVPQPGRRQRKDLLGFPSPAATWYYLSNHSKVEASHQVPYPRTQQANLPACSPHYPFHDERQVESYEYQLYFGVTRPGNRTQVFMGELLSVKYHHIVSLAIKVYGGCVPLVKFIP